MALRGIGIRETRQRIVISDTGILRQGADVRGSLIVDGTVNINKNLMLTAPGILLSLGYKNTPNTVQCVDIVVVDGIQYIPFIAATDGIITYMSGVSWQSNSSSPLDHLAIGLSNYNGTMRSENAPLLIPGENAGDTGVLEIGPYDRETKPNLNVLGIVNTGDVRYLETLPFTSGAGGPTAGDVYTIVIEITGITPAIMTPPPSRSRYDRTVRR